MAIRAVRRGLLMHLLRCRMLRGGLLVHLGRRTLLRRRTLRCGLLVHLLSWMLLRRRMLRRSLRRCARLTFAFSASILSRCSSPVKSKFWWVPARTDHSCW